MNLSNTQQLETAIAIGGFLITYIITRFLVNNALKSTQLQRGRRKIIVKAIHLLSFLALVIILIAIWGVKQSELVVFVGSILTAIGVAFFAQWSLLSNITSSLLLFFNHPVKIGDRIKILDKDYPFEGVVTDLNYFFVQLKAENGEIITVPNSLFFQKSTSILEK